MTAVLPRPRAAEHAERVATPRRYLMCRPEHFEVSYAINPWMDVTRGADRDLAVRQWETLRRTYLALGHEVELIDPEPGLPDMVFAANGGLVIEGHALGARFTHAERRAEGPAYLRRLAGPSTSRPSPSRCTSTRARATSSSSATWCWPAPASAPTRARTARCRSCSASRSSRCSWSTRASTTSTPRWPCSTTRPSPTTPRRSARAAGRSCSGSSRTRSWPPRPTPSSSVSTPCPTGATSSCPQRRPTSPSSCATRGYEPVGVDLSELLKAGGSVKCCTLEIRA